MTLITLGDSWINKCTLITCVCQIHATLSSQKDLKFRPRVMVSGRKKALGTFLGFLLLTMKHTSLK